MRDSTARLIAIHGLEGSAAEAVRERLAEHLRTDSPLPEGKAAMMGGVLSGALSGLAADLAAGGLTLGAGTLIGAIAGALGGAGIARGYNVLRGRSATELRWDDELLDQLVSSALLRYLAVAHFGRGRGAWRESEYPAFWREVVQSVVGCAASGIRGALGSSGARLGCRRDRARPAAAAGASARDSPGRALPRRAHAEHCTQALPSLRPTPATPSTSWSSTATRPPPPRARTIARRRSSTRSTAPTSPTPTAASSTRLRLVHFRQVNYNESGDFGTDHERLRGGDDGYMDEITTLRTTYGDDLVSLFIENGTVLRHRLPRA